MWYLDRDGEVATKFPELIRSRTFEYIHYLDLRRNLIRRLVDESILGLINRLIPPWKSELHFLDGTQNLLVASLRDVLEPHGDCSGCGECPTIWHLIRRLDRIKHRLDGRERLAWDTAQNRLRSLQTLAGEVFDCAVGHDLESLMTRNIVFDLRGLDALHRFIVADLVSAVMAIRQRRPSQQLHVFAIDELHRVATAIRGKLNGHPSSIQRRGRAGN